MSLPEILRAVAENVAGLQSAAADLQSSGAIRSEQWTRWQSMRTTLDQLAELMRTAEEVTAEAGAVANESSSAVALKLDALGGTLAELVGTVHGLAARLAPAAPALVAPPAPTEAPVQA